MPQHGCSGGLMVTLLVFVVLVPLQYFLPKLSEPLPPPPEQLAEPHWLTFYLVHFPTLDILFTVLLALAVLYIHISEWVQIKLIERKIVKLNRQLRDSVARMREWEEHEEQLERDLRTVQSATAEYNLMFYLLQRRALARAAGDKRPSR